MLQLLCSSGASLVRTACCVRQPLSSALRRECTVSAQSNAAGHWAQPQLWGSSHSPSAGLAGRLHVRSLQAGSSPAQISSEATARRRQEASVQKPCTECCPRRRSTWPRAAGCREEWLGRAAAAPGCRSAAAGRWSSLSCETGLCSLQVSGQCCSFSLCRDRQVA